MPSYERTTTTKYWHQLYFKCYQKGKGGVHWRVQLIYKSIRKRKAVGKQIKCFKVIIANIKEGNTSQFTLPVCQPFKNFCIFIHCLSIKTTKHVLWMKNIDSMFVGLYKRSRTHLSYIFYYHTNKVDWFAVLITLLFLAFICNFSFNQNYLLEYQPVLMNFWRLVYSYCVKGYRKTLVFCEC